MGGTEQKEGRGVRVVTNHLYSMYTLNLYPTVIRLVASRATRIRHLLLEFYDHSVISDKIFI